jgi:hypothetical protein
MTEEEEKLGERKQGGRQGVGGSGEAGLAAVAALTSIRNKTNRGREARAVGFVRHCRTMADGASLPRQDLRRGSASATLAALPGPYATSPPCHAAMHGATEWFGRAIALGTGKSVSFLKKFSVKFKNSFQKVLKIKKSRSQYVYI